MSQSPEAAPRPHRGRARFIASTIVLLGVLGAGLLGGFVAGHQQAAPAGGHGHDHGAGAGHDEAAHAAHGPALSERTLANLGVEVGEAAVSEFVRTLDVPAEVESLPLAEIPVTSPIAGVVRAAPARPGQALAPGAVVLEILRDAYPPPALTLTEPILRPLNEDHHAAALGVRTAGLALELALAEKERLAGLAPEAGSPERMASRVLREVEYAERRARLELGNAVHEAERHGLTPEEIDRLRRGEGDIDVPDLPDMRRVLARNRLWSEAADAALALLPEGVRSAPRTAAVLGELAGAGRLTPALLEALRTTPELAHAFLDLAGLVQAGTTPAALLRLAEQGALDAVVMLRAPPAPGAAWDVAQVAVRPGERVEAGAVVARLRDEREMALRLDPSPSDLEALGRALAAGAALAAEPLVRGAGLPLAGVRLIALTGGDGARPAGALARVANTVAAEVDVAGVGRVRSWTLRPGMRYVVHVPVARLPGRFVLPADAIAYRGAEAVVLLKSGGTFKPIPVRLEHHDARVAVVEASGAIFPGDLIVLHGAPALALGLLAGAGAGDPHAGHHH